MEEENELKPKQRSILLDRQKSYSQDMTNSAREPRLKKILASSIYKHTEKCKAMTYLRASSAN